MHANTHANLHAYTNVQIIAAALNRTALTVTKE